MTAEKLIRSIRDHLTSLDAEIGKLATLLRRRDGEVGTLKEQAVRQADRLDELEARMEDHETTHRAADRR